MESLKEVLQNHEQVKMDDPEERGDLYLLAPMRLLTPILEEPEPEHKADDFNRSVMTVISEMLTSHSKNMQIYNHTMADRTVTADQSQVQRSFRWRKKNIEYYFDHTNTRHLGVQNVFMTGF